MKRFLAIMAFVFAFSTTVQAQFVPSVAVSAGLPVGDIKDQTSFAISADLYFMKSINSTIGLGITTGYTIYFAKDFDSPFGTVEGTNTSYIPLAAALRFNITEDLSIGSDVGFAFGLNDNDGGFYYKPTIGFNIGDESQLMLSYQGISEDVFNVNYVGLGFAFGL